MNCYHYKCYNCLVDITSEGILYCPFCGSSLRQEGIAEYAARDYVKAGWNCIAFRSVEAGFVVKNVVREGSHD